ncbi:unnamed protein product [Prorocentrum cordatum]|uniref:Uncharacterized protein n=1 Tax=Prorocentrum cordatum TaxID=2364126 RepID=A0ABN9Y2E2_9DINO|nr:unnamed protein product [Polarella glacialis]
MKDGRLAHVILCMGKPNMPMRASTVAQFGAPGGCDVSFGYASRGSPLSLPEVGDHVLFSKRVPSQGGVGKLLLRAASILGRAASVFLCACFCFGAGTPS